jgi:hypothetical protein
MLGDQAIILPGARVINLEVLEGVRALVASGGTVIATSILPSKASALADEEQTVANDRRVRQLIRGLFGIDPTGPMPTGSPVIHPDPSGGRAAFVPHPDVESLDDVLDRLGLAADVRLEAQPRPTSGTGRLGYIHKVRGDQHVYYFGNSSDEAVDTVVELRGLFDLETWHLKTGSIERVRDTRRDPDSVVTRFPLRIDPVSSVCIVGRPV